MTTRDELAAIDCHKQSIQRAIDNVSKSNTPCATCGMLDLLRIELWKLEHPIIIKPVSKTLLAGLTAVGSGIGAVITRFFWDM